MYQWIFLLHNTCSINSHWYITGQLVEQHKAVKSLVRHGFDVVPVGIRNGAIMWQKIIIGKPEIKDIHTVTLYLNPKNQEEYYNYIIELAPKRIIFNPGSENQELIE